MSVKSTKQYQAVGNIMSSFFAVIKFIAFIVLCIAITPFQLAILAFSNGKIAYILPCVFHKIACKIFRIKVIITGAPISKAQTLFVSNHLSYLDIIAIGSFIRASFVAKNDVASWPVFGFLSKLQQTAFISRNRNDAKKEKSALENMLKDGKSLIIFPEGTSTDGRSVTPFKSSLFSILYKGHVESLNVQAFSITMTSVDGQKAEPQEIRDIYSWHNQMDTSLAAHLWRFAKGQGAVITIKFHDAFSSQNFNERKTLAKHCYDIVSSDVEAFNKTL